jgi:hypothetical protein
MVTIGVLGPLGAAFDAPAEAAFLLDEVSLCFFVAGAMLGEAIALAPVGLRFSDAFGFVRIEVFRLGRTEGELARDGLFCGLLSEPRRILLAPEPMPVAAAGDAALHIIRAGESFDSKLFSEIALKGVLAEDFFAMSPALAALAAARERGRLVGTFSSATVPPEEEGVPGGRPRRIEALGFIFSDC